ncbi:exocyst complex component 1-like [Oenanthe melanoleuca]|uniref:exocyst complex component 1-like n=1 Tax=Oenanthe melanoleuca TaxID=2939378 RepID=UPI0024C10DED|nr:exocyst complex component 1-like [Oenanthe melanoleuca]
MQRPREAELQEGLGTYQEMSPEEATAILELMEEHEPLLNNSVAFAEQLGRELQELDEANLRAIISSEQQVTQLMSSIDEALAEVGRVEQTLQVCDELLGSVKQQMDHIQGENALLHRVASNRARLMEEMLFLTSQLHLSREHRAALSRADLSSPAAVGACTAAAQALSACMAVPLHPSYRKLQAVAEQLILFETLKQNFENSFIKHITNIFKLQGNSQSPALGTVVAPNHGHHHQELLPYTPLMAWLRNINPVLFWDLPKVYSQNLGRLYEREIKALFEQAKIALAGRRKASLQEIWEKPMGRTRRESQEETPGRGNISRVLEQVLSQLQPLCASEQKFLQEFFWLGCDSLELQGSAPQGGEPRAPPEEPPCTQPWSQPEEATAQVLSELLSCLEPELRAFLDSCSRAQPLGCLQVLATLSDSVLGAWGSSPAPSPFLLSLLGNVLLLAKSNFNKCIGTLCKEVEEAKTPSRTRGGILPCVSRFQELVDFSEEVLRTSQSRGELDKAQLRLASSVFSSISSLSSANLKVNTDMVMMENFHHVHNFLCQKNIPCLEDKKREAKQRFREHMEKYVTTSLGQLLERLQDFFAGVKALLAQGVKEEEVSFQLAYSKQELRKVMAKYPGKEVRRALESLYRTIHKYLSPEENLLPVTGAGWERHWDGWDSRAVPVGLQGQGWLFQELWQPMEQQSWFSRCCGMPWNTNPGFPGAMEAHGAAILVFQELWQPMEH